MGSFEPSLFYALQKELCICAHSFCWEGKDVLIGSLVLQIKATTGDPRFTRFQFARIHTARFFQGLRSMGKMGSMEPFGFRYLLSNL